MPRDRNVRRALELQDDPSLPPSLQLREGLCPILLPDKEMKIRLERHDDPPVCPGGCAIRRFFENAKRDGVSVELDVGCGYGRFSRGHAAANPGIRLLGIEQDDARVARTDVTARRAGITNLAYVVGEARYALEYCIPPASVSAVFLLFSDPWPKDRHARNRLFRKANIDLIVRLLVPGGFLHAATDNGTYFAQMLETMDGDSRFESVAPYERGENEKTDFELKFLAQGKTVNAASWRMV